MSVRRTVAQSSAGLMLLAAFAMGPTVAFAAPGDPSDGGGDPPPPQTDCSTEPSNPESYVPELSLSSREVEIDEPVSLTVRCFPERGEVDVTVIGPSGVEELEQGLAVTPSSVQVWEFTPEAAGEYSFQISMSGDWSNNVQFTVPKAEEETTPPDEGEEDPDPTTPPPDDEGEDGGDQGDDDQSTGEDENNTGDDSGTDDSEEQDTGDGDEADNSGNSDQGDDSSNGDDQDQDRGQENDRNSGEESQDEDSSEGDDTNASEGDENAADRKPAPQPPAAPGSATNDFPAATPEPTADQKQSAALAALMTSLFANGVSSGEVGTTPDKARTVIDPSADASEIEVPSDGASDAGGASEDGTGSGASDSDALAATGSDMLVPAGIAGLAILAGAGLKIHQIRRDR